MSFGMFIIEEYTIDQSALRELPSLLMKKDPFAAKTHLNSCPKNEKLMHDFHNFITHASDACSM